MGGCQGVRAAANVHEHENLSSPPRRVSTEKRPSFVVAGSAGSEASLGGGAESVAATSTYMRWQDDEEEEEDQETINLPDSFGIPVTHMMARLVTTSVEGQDEAPRAVGEADLAGFNGLLIILWPYLRKAISKKARYEMLERAAVEIEKRSEWKLTELEVEVDVGDRPPTLTGMRAYTRRKKEEQDFQGFQLDIDFHWKTHGFKMQPKIHMSGPHMLPVNITEVSVKDVELTTTGSVLLAPLISEEPCFGGAQVFFPNLPDVDLHLDGFSGAWHSAMSKKLLKRVLRKMTLSLVTDSLVLPKRTLLKARPDVSLETLVAIKSPLPLGLLEVEVLDSRNLRQSDILHRATDPYVSITVGDSTIKTWLDGPDYLPIYNLAQVVELAVMNKNLMVKDELLGHMALFTVWSFWKELGVKDGFGEAWFLLEARQGKQGGHRSIVPAGELKLRVRFLIPLSKHSVEMKHFSSSTLLSSRPGPSLVTVKVLGLEGEVAQAMTGAKCTVSIEPGMADHDAGGIGQIGQRLQDAMHLMGAVSNKGSGAVRKRKRSYAWGGAVKAAGMPTTLSTGKAKTWAQDLQLKKALHLSPEAVRAIEQLRYRENWDDDKIAGMFGISNDMVKAAAELRPSFGAVWHEALHFVQYADEPALDGSVLLTVRLPSRLPVKAQLAVDHDGGRITDKAALLSSVIAPNGLVGSVRLNMSTEPIAPDTRWSRRVRARLRRPDQQLVQQEPLIGDAQCDPGIGVPLPGCLIEFLVEVRPLVPGDPADSVEDGQAVVGVCRAFGEDDEPEPARQPSRRSS